MDDNPNSKNIRIRTGLGTILLDDTNAPPRLTKAEKYG